MIEFHTVTNVRKIERIQRRSEDRMVEGMELFAEDAITEAQRPGQWPVLTGASRDGFTYDIRKNRNGNIHLTLGNTEYYAPYVENTPQNRKIITRILRNLDLQDYV